MLVIEAVQVNVSVHAGSAAAGRVSGATITAAALHVSRLLAVVYSRQVTHCELEAV